MVPCAFALLTDEPAKQQRFPLPAFMIIATVRGFLLNFGVYHATRSALQLPFEVRAISLACLPRALTDSLCCATLVEPCNHVHHVLRDDVRDSHRHHQSAPHGVCVPCHSCGAFADARCAGPS